jgi:hypothetical protein
MTHKETVTRNIGLTFDFVNCLLDSEAGIEKLPDNFNLEFSEKDFPKRERKQNEHSASQGMEKQNHIAEHACHICFKLPGIFRRGNG